MANSLKIQTKFLFFSANAGVSGSACGGQLCAIKGAKRAAHNWTTRALSDFRVKAPVARRPPHRPGREDFPHPVPRSSIISDKQTSQATPRLAHNCCYVATPDIRYYALYAASAVETSPAERLLTPPFSDFFYLTNSARLSLYVRIQPLMVCSCISHQSTGNNRVALL